MCEKMQRQPDRSIRVLHHYLRYSDGLWMVVRVDARAAAASMTMRLDLRCLACSTSESASISSSESPSSSSSAASCNSGIMLGMINHACLCRIWCRSAINLAAIVFLRMHWTVAWAIDFNRRERKRNRATSRATGLLECSCCFGSFRHSSLVARRLTRKILSWVSIREVGRVVQTDSRLMDIYICILIFIM